MNEILILGIGNPFRGDDAAGWAVIDVLEQKSPKGVKLCKVRGDSAQIIDLFTEYSTVYVIDACQMNAPSGFWKRIDAHKFPIPSDAPQTSTHGMGITQAIDLAKVLGILPSKLIIYAINGEHYNLSTSPSLSVGQAIDTVAQHILQEEDIVLCTKRV